MTETLEQRLIRHEGLRLTPYADSLGQLTIGVGRCLTTKGISRDEALYLFHNDITYVKEHVATALPWTDMLNETRKQILWEMAFQLGMSALLAFTKMLNALKNHDYAKASYEMVHSTWHTQTPSRCEELANAMLTGQFII